MEKEKRFLLVIHGGLVCYIILHSLLIPFVRFVALGDHLFNEAIFSLLFHLFFFWFLWFGNEIPKIRKYFSIFFYLGVVSTIANLVFSYFYFPVPRLNIHHFTELLAIGSTLIFFSVLALKFSHRFVWSQKSASLAFTFVVSVVSQFYLNDYFIPTQVEAFVVQKEEFQPAPKDYGKLGCQGSQIYTHQNAMSFNSVEILDCGFERNFFIVEKDKKFLVKNSKGSTIYLRLYEVKEDGGSRQVKRLVIPSGKEIEIPRPHESSLYVLKSLLYKNLGFVLIKNEQTKINFDEVTFDYVKKGEKYYEL
ncbi:MAG: hypothetical protein ACPGJV_01150 [Bacteriovoracaceae bacterium]